MKKAMYVAFRELQVREPRIGFLHLHTMGRLMGMLQYWVACEMLAS